jgi:hypothetical protein
VVLLGVCAVPAEGKLAFEGFQPYHMAHSDDHLFLTDIRTRLRVYEFATDCEMPVLVRELDDLKQPRGMGLHKATGTLLVACMGSGAAGVGSCIEMLDTRPPPAQWRFSDVDRLSAYGPFSIAIDEPNGFVYVAGYKKQTLTQYRATTKTADEKARVVGKSAVDLKLTAVRMIDGVQYIAPTRSLGELTAVAVLSPSTVLLSHGGRTLEVLTHSFTDAAEGTDCKLAGPVGEVRVLHTNPTGTFATGIVVDAERRRIYFGESYAGRVHVYDADSGRPLAEVPAVVGPNRWGSASDVAVIDGVFVSVNHPSTCLLFRAVERIPGLGSESK